MMQQPLVGKGLFIVMITLRHITVDRTPLDKWSARPRDPSLVNIYYPTRRHIPLHDATATSGEGPTYYHDHTQAHNSR